MPLFSNAVDPYNPTGSTSHVNMFCLQDDVSALDQHLHRYAKSGIGGGLCKSVINPWYTGSEGHTS